MVKNTVKYTNIVKYIVKNSGYIVIFGLAVGTIVTLIYRPIIDILGLSGIREYLDSIVGSGVVVGGITGFICGSVGVWFMQKKTDLFSGLS